VSAAPYLDRQGSIPNICLQSAHPSGWPSQGRGEEEQLEGGAEGRTDSPSVWKAASTDVCDGRWQTAAALSTAALASEGKGEGEGAWPGSSGAAALNRSGRLCVHGVHICPSPPKY